jgi:hypothetical protein
VTTLRVHHDPLQVSERILPRLEALGLCIVTLGTDGQIAVTGKATPLHALVAGSMLLAPAWINCPAAATGEPFELWPGATLVPLSSSRRRRLSLTRPAEARCAVLLITPEFLGAEQLHRVCDSRGVDWRATVHAVMNERLPSAAEAQRIAQMITWMRQDSSELDRRDSELHTLSGQLGDSYEELSLLYRLSASMSVNQAPAEFLSDSCSELRQVLGLRWMALQLIDTDPRLTLEAKREERFYAEQSESLANFISILGTALAVIFSVGAVVGATITMFGAVASRIGEIGTLRALGFRRGAVLVAFLGESLLLALIGGVVGVAAASLMQVVNVSTTNFATFSELAFQFTLTPKIAVQSLLFALAMGFVGGFVPAWRAARLKIVDCLRAA